MKEVMNFKPTYLKSIASIIFGIVSLFLIGNLFPKVFEICVNSGWEGVCYFDNKLMILALLVSVVIIYFIWSLIQKKKYA